MKKCATSLPSLPPLLPLLLVLLVLSLGAYVVLGATREGVVGGATCNCCFAQGEREPRLESKCPESNVYCNLSAEKCNDLWT